MNMFFSNTKPIIALVALSLLATLAAATPAVVARTGGGGGGGGSSCAPSTSLQCCEHVGTYSQVLSAIPLPALFSLLSLLVTLFGTIDLALNAVLGITCSGIAVGGSCNAQTVCCENVAFSGLVNVGCTAIDIL